MSDRLKQVFEKHSTDVDRFEDMMSFDQFIAALEEIVPSEGNIETEFPSTYAQINYIRKPGVILNAEYLDAHGIDFVENYNKQQGAKWLRSKILGEKTQ